jgi:galactofuranosylgalactofuranosylrhamnosyl-N-acetylglucosaminyl-diphospho-decaprenol beta-1,5/1,6-galactofuranosyltransferase
LTEYKIMNILLSDAPRFLMAPTLLVRSDAPWHRADEQGAWVLTGPGSHDFTTYFNALSVQKWREYTVAHDFTLHLELRGAACAFVQTRADSLSWSAEDIPSTRTEIPASQQWRSYDFRMAGDSADVIEGFRIDAEGDVEIRDARYGAIVDSGLIRPVELALCTTTFKKEQYVMHNIELVRRNLLGSDDPVARHFTMHVVDNGRTLDADGLSGGRVHVWPNDNAGGSGGFARGMIEAMRQEPRATHVLLMDDDVIVSPESIARTYALLAIVRDEYVDAFVAGAMMNMHEPDVRWEETGFVDFKGGCRSIKPVARMSLLHDVVGNEAFDVPDYMPHCEDQTQRYAAWWYCVIPMSQIDAHGLPMPIFVRADDAEYGLRCRPRFITLNSICVWHEAFYLRYSAPQERYQMVRNCFINRFASGYAPLSNIEDGQLDTLFKIELRKFNYTNAELVLRGFEDFLKGPQWIMQPVAQQAFLSACRDAEKLVPLEELAERASSLGVDLSQVTSWKMLRDLPISRRDSILWSLTDNGQRFGRLYAVKGKVAVISSDGWELPMGKLKGAEYVIAIDMSSRKGVIRHRDNARAKELRRRYARDLKEYRSRKQQLLSDYRAAFPQMTSVEFWKGYLRLD